mmetsp:Transcript_14336/g.21158  ORF Transcript_14336/g.21158 Transcript_14336/m.21158 type:complete len:439 (+) Transcript_14336:223-1539(+)|eukprot:CAMPEP_0194222898 /NCGR_PEP_ID=MMETSP0156-20130528/34024_1 /TAXON_ID=33649 /ORGANISM="Thalassionema nitzschioides, Strain L26-B" /LENGTH=438 /DNA_ID=CAMNT_0038953869 /DNA_START=148 /DNA_END=1464 /DNA_ORIENTATION=+
MSRQINLPINQVRLTNVATVRMNKGGKRFEIACYRNKVVNYRQGIETDLSEVLQTERVFTNVSKGEFAKSKDLGKIFGTTDEEEIIKLILTKGDLQVSDLERSQQYENMNREIATWISEHGVHPVTQRPYTIPQIRQAMKKAEYTIHTTRSMKKQYLDCFKKVQENSDIEIVRAKMKLQLLYPTSDESAVNEIFDMNSIQPVASEQLTDAESRIAILLVDPSLYRTLENLAKQVNGRLEILKQVVMREGDSNLEEEMRQNQKTQPALRTEVKVVAPTEELDFQLKIEDNDRTERDTPMKNLKEKTPLDFDPGDEIVSMTNMRKNQKKAEKKSKKAKRREKEEAEDRKARVEAEETRRNERGVCRQTDAENYGGTRDTNIGEAKSCNSCGGLFTSVALYRAHFRSNWHRYNMKLKLKGISPISEKEFLLCDSDAFFEDV